MPDSHDRSSLELVQASQTISGRAWQRRPFIDRHAKAMASAHGLSIVAAEILSSRGVEPEGAQSFLTPALRELMPDPAILKDMDRAAERVSQALSAGEAIGVFGDYDVDGATSTALLLSYFKQLGSKTLYHIPDRQKEGYGPNAAALLGLKEKGASLILTVDCGTLSYQPLAAAKQAGLDVIVLDHHKAEAVLPEAYAVVNPNRLDDESALGHLAAVGVTFLFLVALQRQLKNVGFFNQHLLPDLLGLLDLVALGTVCDVVPLVGLNRAFVRQGLKILATRRHIGLKALCDVGRISERPGAYHLGFVLGPRINAGGRVGEADLGVRLLMADSEAGARQIAERLDHYNQERQAIERTVLSEAMTMAEEMVSRTPDLPLVMVLGEDWHPGVIGIVASRLKDKFHLPSFVLCRDGDEVKGSGRSVSGVDMGAAVIEAVQAGLLIKGGGHAMAAGLTASGGAIKELRDFIGEILLPQVTAVRQAGVPHYADAVISARGATAGLVEQVEEIGPFGSGNPSPRFLIKDVHLAHVDVVGQNHVRCRFKGRDGASLKAMAFRMSDERLGQALLGGMGERFHLLGRLKKDDWAGGDVAEVTIDDIACLDR